MRLRPFHVQSGSISSDSDMRAVVMKTRTRRWFQFSLRSLLVFVLIVSIAMSWVGVKMERARKQREAVEVIRKVGGGVSHAGFLMPLVPKWARAVFGEDFFFDVVAVYAFGVSARAGDQTDFGDDEVAYLKRLTSLTFLELRGTQVTDAGLEHLEGLTNLESLDLSDTQVTAQGVDALRQALPDCNISLESQP